MAPRGENNTGPTTTAETPCASSSDWLRQTGFEATGIAMRSKLGAGYAWSSFRISLPTTHG